MAFSWKRASGEKKFPTAYKPNRGRSTPIVIFEVQAMGFSLKDPKGQRRKKVSDGLQFKPRQIDSPRNFTSAGYGIFVEGSDGAAAKNVSDGLQFKPRYIYPSYFWKCSLWFFGVS